MYKRILVGIDEGQPAQRAVDAAADLAKQVGAELILLHVVDLGLVYVPEVSMTDTSLLAHLREQGEQLLTDTIERLPPGITVRRVLVEGEPAESVITAAQEWQADLIVVGSDSRGRLAHFLLGSTADSVIRKAPCPVMTTRAYAMDARLPKTDGLTTPRN
jgi:nucleotide-binding universal stress UspA family protein